MNFESKTSQNQFLLILSETQEYNLKQSNRSFQVGVQFYPGHSQPHKFINSFYAIEYSHFNNTGPLFSDFYQYTCIFLFFTVMLKIGETTPLMDSSNVLLG